MAKRKRQRKKSYSGGQEMFMIFLVVAVIAAGIYFLAGDKAADTSGTGGTGTTDLEEVDVGDDTPAYVNDEGECVSRTGEIDMGLCCGVWDAEAEEIKWVLCETLVDKTDTQAFFKFESGDTLSNVAVVMYAITLTNEGNAVADVKINSIDVTAVTGGDIAAIQEIESAFNSIIGTYRTVQPGVSTTFSMSSSNPIYLDVPGGTSHFIMTDGIYDATIGISIKDEQGTVSDGGTRTVRMQVEQESLMFSIDVSTI